jgi:hypothetical protein
MDDKEKSVIDKFVDTVTSVVGEAVKSAVMPTRDTEAEALTEKTNEQMFLGDAAIAPEAATALIAPKKTDPKKRSAAPKKSAKQLAQPATKTPEKTAKQAAKKSSKKSAKKTKSSAGRKAVGKNKTAKKIAKKKKAKKSKR